MSRMNARAKDKKGQKANEKFIKSLKKQLNDKDKTSEDGHRMVGTAENDIIGQDNWGDLDKLKALESR